MNLSKKFKCVKIKEKIRQTLQPDFEIFLKYGDGSIEEYDGDCDLEKLISLIWIFKTPLLVTGKYINLEINDDELYLKNGKIYEIVLRCPMKVNGNKAKAEFDVEKKELKVEVEVRNILREALKKAENENNFEEVKKQNKTIEMKSNLLFDLV